jgi:hypothetical protein
MSTKTLRKRISLVAVTALTAGVLSVVAAPAASANIAAGTVTSQAAYDAAALNVAVIPTTTGAAVSNGALVNSNQSLGLIYKDASSTTAQSATMLSTGALALYTLGATTISIVASGGTFSSAVSGNSATAQPIVRSDLKGIISGVSTATNMAVVWTPGAIGTFTISLYKGDGAGTVPSTTLGYARGTLVGQVTVTTVASSTAGAYSATYSSCNLTRTAGETSTGVNTSGSTSINNGLTGYLVYALKDVYGTALTAGLPVVATATGGVVLDIASSAASAVSSTDVDTAVSGTVSIAQAVANVPVTTTVTITYNGTLVCTQTLTIRGEVASLKVTPVAAQANVSASQITTNSLNGLGGGTFVIDTFDSAGNKVIPLQAGGSVAATTQFATVSSTVDSVVTGLTYSVVATGTASTDATGLWPLSSTQGYATCGSNKAGTNAALKVTFQNPSGSIITSPAFSQRCAGLPSTYTASWDKASYVQGDIAKLTVSFKDTAGNAAASVTTGTTATITAPMMTLVGSIATGKKADINGAIVHTYSVGTTGTFSSGTYNSLVDYSTLTDVLASIATVSYKVSTGGDTTTNADVLKSIVALIASINKQIQALQKLILKR